MLLCAGVAIVVLLLANVEGEFASDVMMFTYV